MKCENANCIDEEDCMLPNVLTILGITTVIINQSQLHDKSMIVQSISTSIRRGLDDK